jgi:hypothetical protein
MITKINGIRIPRSDPVHHLTGAALEQRINQIARATKYHAMVVKHLSLLVERHERLVETFYSLRR